MVLTPFTLSADQRHWSSMLCLSTFMLVHLVAKKCRPDRWMPYSSQILHPGSMRVVVAWIIFSFQKMLSWYSDAFALDPSDLQKSLTIFKNFLCQPSNKPLGPSKELNLWENNSSNLDHITIKDSMPSLKPSYNWPRDYGVIFCSLAVGKVISESRQVSPDDFETSHSTKRRHKQEHACTDRDQWDSKIEHLPFFFKHFQEGQKNFDGISPILGHNVSCLCTYPCLKVLIPSSFARTESGNESTLYRPCW